MPNERKLLKETESLKKEIKKIIFYPGMTRDLRGCLIGHLYEICQKYPVVLLTEPLTPELETTLARKELFPKLEKIITVNAEPGKRYGLFKEWKRHRRLSRLSRSLIKKYRPDVVITSSDYHSIFELYLCRCAKRFGAIVVVFQGTNIGSSKVISKWVDHIHAYEMFGGVEKREIRYEEFIGERSKYPKKLVDFMRKWQA